MADTARRPRRDPFAAIPAAAYDEPIHHVRRPGVSLFLVSDPAAVRQVLVEKAAQYPKTRLERRYFASIFGDGLLSSDGEVWRGHRRAMAPAFDPRAVAAYAPAMIARTQAFLAGWEALDPAAEVDVLEDMTTLTLRLISGTVFSGDSDGLIGPIGEAMAAAHKVMRRPNLLDFLPLVGDWRADARDRAARAIFREVDAAIHTLVAERRRRGGPPRDLLDRLIAAEDDAARPMSAEEVRDQILTIFVAGHETTAVAMTWVWHLLGRHPEAEARLHAELDAVLGDRPPSAADLPALTYARQVVEEAMRLYPPAPGLSMRQATADDELCGRKVPRGALIAVYPWVIHRHRRLWDDPERFDPDRFAAEAVAGRPRLAYLPFGAGPRVCIGANLAMTEATLILAAVAQRYSLRPLSEAPPALQHRVTLRPYGGLPMRLVPRPAGHARAA